MLKEEVTVYSPLGIHAKPSHILGEIASRFECKITFQKGDVEVNAKSAMGIILLGATYLSSFTVITEGVDEEQAMKKLIFFFAEENALMLEDMKSLERE